ncbi:MAG: signal peptidase II [Thermodesulfobacteriota bacterium]|nr:MAG: signal peptidase II [Thermodesulfobacteriota bacterium]
MKKNWTIFLVTVVVVIALDQGIKAVIINRLYLNEVIEVVPGLFNIVYYKNTGAAFGILRKASAFKTLFFTLATGAAIVFIVIMVKRSRDALLTISLSLIAGGAVGNLIDRLVSGSVTDFLDLYWGGYHWPAFNVADSAITVGVVATILIFYLKNPDRPR